MVGNVQQKWKKRTSRRQLPWRPGQWSSPPLSITRVHVAPCVTEEPNPEISLEINNNMACLSFSSPFVWADIYLRLEKNERFVS